MPPRPTARDYRHFPEEYTQLLDMLERDGHVSLGPFVERLARSTLRDLYRWKGKLLEEVETNPDNEHAADLLNVFNTVQLRVEQANKDDAASWHIHGSINPVVAAIRRKLAQ